MREQATLGRWDAGGAGGHGVDFVVVGFGLGALGILLGIALRDGGSWWWRPRPDRSVPGGEVTRRVGWGRACRAGGRLLALGGGAICAATLLALALGLADRTGAALVLAVVLVAFGAVLAWSALYTQRFHPRPPRTRIAARTATATAVPSAGDAMPPVTNHGAILGWPDTLPSEAIAPHPLAVRPHPMATTATPAAAMEVPIGEAATDRDDTAADARASSRPAAASTEPDASAPSAPTDGGAATDPGPVGDGAEESDSPPTVDAGPAEAAPAGNVAGAAPTPSAGRAPSRISTRGEATERREPRALAHAGEIS